MIRRVLLPVSSYSFPIADSVEKLEEPKTKDILAGLGELLLNLILGVVGSIVLILSGFITGIVAFVTPNNISLFVYFITRCELDFQRLKEDPIFSFMYQKGYDFAQYILQAPVDI